MIKKLRVHKIEKNIATLIDDESSYTMKYSETKGKLKEGQSVLAFVADESASMKIYNHLQTTENHKIGDKVEGIVYEIHPEMGAFFAVNDTFHGLIPLNEMYKEIKVGARLSTRVTNVKDGKLRLSIREKKGKQIEGDTKVVLENLETGDGILFLCDDTDPEIIKKKLNLSKKAFKRAVGRLLSEGKIELIDGGIRLL